jgi:non-ribosomal peptide synthetase component F
VQVASKLPDPHLQEVDREKTDMIQQITNLTPERRSLLILLLKRDASPDLPILAVSRNQELPLSFSQQRLWFLDQLEPGSASYNVSEALRLEGPLNATALEQSVNEIVRRHEALRTTFASGEGGPVQIISETQRIRLIVVDLANLHQNEREAQVTALVTREVQRPFDLVRGPLFRATLLRLNEQEHILLLTLHHAVVDEWSIGILYREMGALYEAFCAGQSSPLPELPIQYPDYAVWQREWLQGEVLERLLAYWRERLRGVLPVIELPADRPRPAAQTYRGARQSFVLSKEMVKGLTALSRQEGVTLFMTMLAAFQTLLSRYTKQDDIIVGTDVANRTRMETERLIGFFVNILVMRTDLSGNPTFRELLGRVREVALGAYAHQDLPFEKLVEELRPERDVSRNPLVQVLFVMQNVPRQSLKLPGLTTSSFEISSATSRFDLALFVTEADQCLTGSWVYRTDLFEGATVEQMSGHFETLLKSIIAQPNAKLNTLEMLTESEKEQETIQGRRHQEAQIEKLRSTRRKTVLFKQ